MDGNVEFRWFWDAVLRRTRAQILGGGAFSLRGGTLRLMDGNVKVHGRKWQRRRKMLVGRSRSRGGVLLLLMRSTAVPWCTGASVRRRSPVRVRSQERRARTGFGCPSVASGDVDQSRYRGSVRRSGVEGGVTKCGRGLGLFRPPLYSTDMCSLSITRHVVRLQGSKTQSWRFGDDVLGNLFDRVVQTVAAPFLPSLFCLRHF